MRHLVVSCAVAIALAAGVASSQVRWPGGRRDEPRAEESGHVAYDGRFVFLRLRYTSDLGGRFRRREPPWAHDYPRAERNLAKILREITYIDPNMEGGNVLTLDDPELHNFPIAYMSEPGFWTLSDKEAEGLRAYLHKGGFVIFDDFRGWDLDNFQAQIRRALPESRLVELDATHPIFHSFFEIDSLEFVQYYDRGKPVFYGIFEDNDPKKRLMVIANYNNDLGEYWEFSDTGFVPIDLSNEAYKYAVNYMIYAMTH